MERDVYTDIDPNLVIDRLGGTTAVAKICDIKPPSVHEWRKNGIPKPRLQFLRVAYPDAFAVASTASTAAQLSVEPAAERTEPAAA